MKSFAFYSTSSRPLVNIRKVRRLSPSTLLCTLKIKFVLCGLTFRACESFVLVVAEFKTPKNHGMQTLDAELTFTEEIVHNS